MQYNLYSGSLPNKCCTLHNIPVHFDNLCSTLIVFTHFKYINMTENAIRHMFLSGQLHAVQRYNQSHVIIFIARHACPL